MILREGDTIKLTVVRAPIYDHPRYVETMRESVKKFIVIQGQEGRWSLRPTVKQKKRRGWLLQGNRQLGFWLTSFTRPPLRYEVMKIEKL